MKRSKTFRIKAAYVHAWDFILAPFGRYAIINPNFFFGVQINRWK